VLAGHHITSGGAERFLDEPPRVIPRLLLAIATLASAAQFSSGVNLVEVYATVTDQDGEPVTGLGRDAFTVFEDGRPQTLTAFAAGEFPLSVALALDRSFSMSGEPLALAKTAAHQFLGELRQDDQAMLIGIGSEVEVLAPLSSPREPLHAALRSVTPWGTTGLHDAIIAGIDHIQPTRGRRALILLSDGDDRYSKATAGEALSHARRADVLVYPVALGDSRPQLFVELAVLTGGRSFHVKDPKQLAPALSSIARELRHQYLLGYSPDRPIDPSRPGWRDIDVRVNREGVRVRARDGYFVRGDQE
jgi:Ca-activated chloride channel family protein